MHVSISHVALKVLCCAEYKKARKRKEAQMAPGEAHIAACLKKPTEPILSMLSDTEIWALNELLHELCGRKVGKQQNICKFYKQHPR